MESTCTAVYISPHEYTMRKDNICLKVLVIEVQQKRGEMAVRGTI